MEVEFQSFKSHPANLELSPVESWFCQFDGRPCLLQTDIKTPPWPFCISPVSSSMKWEMWTSQIWWRQRTQRMKMFRAFRTLMAPEKAWASIVTTDGKYLVNNIIIIQQVLDTCAWSDPLELSAWTTPRRVLVLSQISGDVTLTAVL